MKERPILFNTEMVRAVLDGRKSQTRRVIKPQPDHRHRDVVFEEKRNKLIEYSMISGCWNEVVEHKCPYGKPGDRLWVRETWAIDPVEKGVWFKADEFWTEANSPKWKPSIHMPRKYSRINLEITNIRVERVNDITSYDMVREGVPDSVRQIDLFGAEGDEIRKIKIIPFRIFWGSINKSRGYGWDVNPWVWVVEFKRIND